MKRLATAAAVSLLFAVGAFAQCRDAAPTRVSFERGKASAEINGEMKMRGEACYALRARAGQRMSVSVSSAHDFARFNLFPPSKDHTVAHETSEWSGVLPESGDYTIALHPRTNDEAGSFTLYVSVEAASGGARAGATQPTGGAASPTAGSSPTVGSSSTAGSSGDASGAGSQGYTFDAGEGAYVFDGRPPRGFAELTALELPGVLLRLGADGASVVSVSTDPQAFVDTKGGRQFKAKRVSVKGDEITFETEAVRGVSYQFTGRFTKRQIDKGQLLDAGLKGRLVKFLNGNKIAETQLDLYEAVGG